MIRYVVQRGDTLYEIARRYNTTVQRIVELNNLSDPNLINVGDVLLIDDSPGQTPYQPPAGQQSPPPGSNFNSVIIDGLRYTIYTDQRAYQRGRENVRITLVKCNVTNRTITLRYNTTQRFDFAAVRDGREVWRWSDDQFFAQVTGTEVYRPGECRAYTVTWDLRNRLGNLVAIDQFEIRGFNVAAGYRNRFVPVTIRVQGAGVPGIPDTECPRRNLLQDPSLERWAGPRAPRLWSGQNLNRTPISRTGNFAAELGTVSSRQAVLSQSVTAFAGRLYRVVFWARENVKPGRDSNFRLDVEILLYDARGRFVSRVDPLYTATSIPNNRYQRYSFTTAILPRGTARADLRFIFRPSSGNDNTVKIDDVSFRCIQ